MARGERPPQPVPTLVARRLLARRRWAPLDPENAFNWVGCQTPHRSWIDVGTPAGPTVNEWPMPISDRPQDRPKSQVAVARRPMNSGDVRGHQRHGLRRPHGSRQCADPMCGIDHVGGGDPAGSDDMRCGDPMGCGDFVRCGDVVRGGDLTGGSMKWAPATLDAAIHRGAAITRAAAMPYAAVISWAAA